MPTIDEHESDAMAATLRADESRTAAAQREEPTLPQPPVEEDAFAERFAQGRQLDH